MLYIIIAYILDCLLYVYSLFSSCGIRDIKAPNPRRKIFYPDNADMPDFSQYLLLSRDSKLGDIEYYNGRAILIHMCEISRVVRT
jgi:hypothetical protein